MSKSCEAERTWGEAIKQWLAASLLLDLIVVVVIWQSIGTERMAWAFCQAMWVDACDEVFPDKEPP